MDKSDGIDKSWDHPWTTEEMRKTRREWSLAGDAGLLKHLQQFSENLVSKANKTEEALDSLTTQLSETAILIDNVTNTSLALANTQFIESRVQEDDVEIEKKIENSVQESKDQDLVTADLIASVRESVRQGLRIMDEKYRRMEVIDSDSEEEDDAIVLSVILGPNNPYQDRPLPYVIGSDKWKNSNKIGLESSSSESEQIDEEEEEESESDDDGAAHKVFNMNTAPKISIGRLPSSLSESDNYNQRNDITYLDNEKPDGESQNNINSASESITPIDNISKVTNDSTPNFAEELAKRLGTVRQAEKPIPVDEKSEASINRIKDDLFTPEEDDSVFSNKSDSIFSGNKELFNDQSSANLWKEKPIKPIKTNIIPASIDVPPPISTVSTKPKSAIDDLFADADSEDSDDIFSSKNTVKKISKDNNSISSNYIDESMQKKYLDIVAPTVTSNIATSTPVINVNATNLFSDEEDDGDLFGTSKNERKVENVPTPSGKKPIGGVPILGNILASDVENELSSRIPRIQSSESSGSSSPANNESGATNELVRDSSRNAILNDTINDRGSIVARSNAENLTATNESSSSSGISIHPPSINNTEGSSIGVDFLSSPQFTSTRLKSEEIYRERIASDSLFAGATRNPVNVTSNSNSRSNQRNERNEDTSSTREDDVYETDDVFGPPPLPKTDSKPSKSKISSLFDDSDSGDELFSTTSSGSRSQKSTDFLATTPQYSDKARSTQRKGLFDEEIDIFGSKDSPDVDIFGIASKSSDKEENSSNARKVPDLFADGLFTSSARDSAKDNGAEKAQSTKPKKISLFDDDDDIDDGDLFTTKLTKKDSKAESQIFKNDDENDLFSGKKVTNKKQGNDNTHPIEPMKSGMDDTNDDISIRKTERKGSDILSGNGLFSSTIDSRGLVFEDDDYDDLFGNKSTSTEKKEESKKSTSEVKEGIKSEKSVKDVEKPIESRPSTSNSNIVAAVPQSDVVPENESGKADKIDEDIIHATAAKDIGTTERSENGTKKSPPKSLNIRNTTSSPPLDENGQQPRRTVSGKIKNLMGRMGDLKILSPMDTPPLWRKSEEKTDEEDNTADRDSDDGGCISTQGPSSPPSISEDSAIHKQSQQSTISGDSNVESAISFDEPAQVETLSTAASKTRVRIQAKRRPQSRHARKSALRQSGIDFDTVDASESSSHDEGHNSELPNTLNKESSNSAKLNATHVPAYNSDRLTSSANENIHRIADSNISLAADDKSELGSLSKESSMSANKNTLLSPSTDEEDLFDVPPDLPEDPQKEDTLFGRAPILSPVDKVLSAKLPGNFKPLRDTHIRRTDEDAETEVQNATVDTDSSKPDVLIQSNNDPNIKAITESVTKKKAEQDTTKSKEESFTHESSKEVVDPLRDSSHDPLKDPSQLFAFVTKTPSPEKGKSLLFSEDDSLFASGPKKAQDEQSAKKPVLDLFSDDTEGDLFSTSFSKPVKKPLKDTKISLFDDDAQDDESDSLFGSVAKKQPLKTEAQKAHSAQHSRKKASLFDDNDDNDINLFSEQSEQSQKSDSVGVPEQASKSEPFSGVTESVKTSHITDIFGDQSSGEDDIFATKPVPKKVITSKSLFPSDDDDDDSHIFGKTSSTVESKAKPTDTRSAIKKPILRDLKKTAEKIGEDPLSILQDD